MGGTVKIPTMGPLAKRPSPMPINSRYRQKDELFSCIPSQKESITSATLRLKKVSVETTPACKKNSGNEKRTKPGRKMDISLLGR